jgi:hypothetical protein
MSGWSSAGRVWRDSVRVVAELPRVLVGAWWGRGRPAVNEAVRSRNRWYIAWSAPRRRSALVLQTATSAENDQCRDQQQQPRLRLLTPLLPTPLDLARERDLARDLDRRISDAFQLALTVALGLTRHIASGYGRILGLRIDLGQGDRLVAIQQARVGFGC